MNSRNCTLSRQNQLFRRRPAKRNRERSMSFQSALTPPDAQVGRYKITHPEMRRYFGSKSGNLAFPVFIAKSLAIIVTFSEVAIPVFGVRGQRRVVVKSRTRNAGI